MTRPDVMLILHAVFWGAILGGERDPGVATMRHGESPRPVGCAERRRGGSLKRNERGREGREVCVRVCYFIGTDSAGRLNMCRLTTACVLYVRSII